MDYALIISIIPNILNLLNSIIDLYKSDPKFKKKVKGTGFSKKLFEIENNLAKLENFKDVLLFYARFLPEASAVYALSDKLYEMMQASLKDLNNSGSANYDTTWQSISMMYNSVKRQKNNEIVSRRDACPVSASSSQIQRVNNLIRELEVEFGQADAYLNVRQTANLLSQAQRISQITADLKAEIGKQTEALINSISLFK